MGAVGAGREEGGNLKLDVMYKRRIKTDDLEYKVIR